MKKTYVLTSWSISAVNIMLQLLIILTLPSDRFVELSIIIGLISFLSFFDLGLGAQSLHDENTDFILERLSIRVLILVVLSFILFNLGQFNLAKTIKYGIFFIALLISISVILKNYNLGQKKLANASFFHVSCEMPTLTFKICILVGLTSYNALLASSVMTLGLLLPAIKHRNLIETSAYEFALRLPYIINRSLLAGSKYFLPLGAWAVFLYEIRSLVPSELPANQVYYILLALSVMMLLASILTPIINLHITSANQKYFNHYTKKDIIVTSIIITQIFFTLLTWLIMPIVGDLTLNNIEIGRLVSHFYVVFPILSLSIMNVFICYEYKDDNSIKLGVIYLILTLMKVGILLTIIKTDVFNAQLLYLLTITAQAFLIIMIFGNLISWKNGLLSLLILLNYTLMSNLDF